MRSLTFADLKDKDAGTHLTLISKNDMASGTLTSWWTNEDGRSYVIIKSFGANKVIRLPETYLMVTSD